MSLLGLKENLYTFSFQVDRKQILKSYKHKDVNPGFREVFLFYNRENSHIRSCGPVAWQVKAQIGAFFKPKAKGHIMYLRTRTSLLTLPGFFQSLAKAKPLIYISDTLILLFSNVCLPSVIINVFRCSRKRERSTKL